MEKMMKKKKTLKKKWAIALTTVEVADFHDNGYLNGLLFLTYNILT